ncbi:radical SAM protein [Myxococcota bacterium]|nr:radical SAM protein [Myxococcota bacterium]MBU1379752.1 radical SAM protein [Myxococcota bacterium]MBU1498535.1 radical SAM protein [Myxococcota bacterium]
MLKLINKLGYFPKTCVWELTLGCNLRCFHCGSRAGTPRNDELSLEEMLAVCDELADLGCERVTLSGGEPTTHPHWDTVGKRLVDNGVQVNMISNGISWDDASAIRAKNAGFSSAAFSIDGFEESHDFIRGVAGAYKSALNAVRVCVRNNLPVSIVTTIYRKNLHELKQLGDMLASEGVVSWQLQIGNPAGNMKDHRELVIEPDDLLEIVPLLAEMRRSGQKPRMYIGDNIGYFGPYEEDLRGTGKEIDFWLGCRAGMQVMGIESNGNIKGCLSLPSEMNREDRFLEGNIREKSLTDIWCNPDNFSFNRQFTVDRLGGFCRTCAYNEICRGGCLWTAFSNTGDQFDNPFCWYRVAVEKGLIEPENQS